MTVSPVAAGANADDISEWIAAWRAGDHSARDRLVTTLLPEVRALSERALRRLAYPVSLHASDLVQESLIELLKRGISSTDALHLRALAASIVRTTLVDYLRVRNAAKRGSSETENISITLLHNLGAGAIDQIDLILIHDAMQGLAKLSERATQIVEMRVFGGLAEHEIASVLGVSRATVARDWATAKLWLARALSDPPEEPGT